MHVTVIVVSDLPVIGVAAAIAEMIAAVMQTIPASAHPMPAIIWKTSTRKPPFTSRVHLRIDSAHIINTGTKNSPRPTATWRSTKSSLPAGIELTQTKNSAGNPIAMTAIDHISQASNALCRALCRCGAARRIFRCSAGSLATDSPIFSPAPLPRGSHLPTKLAT
jgi:hypothetical protein